MTANGWLTLDVTVPLDRFTLSVEWKTAGRALGVFGHSGAGKTTLLETVAGLRREARGLVRVNGRTWLDSTRGIRLPPERRGVGYVPQDSLLFPHRDVMGNLTSGRRRAESSGDLRHDPGRVLEILELEEIRHREVVSLSGGERQRVALGRALCSGAEMLLLDEPLAGLDLPLRRRILPYLVRVQDEFGIPTLFVSHDATEVKVLCAEVLVLSAGQVVAMGRPDDVFSQPPVLEMALSTGYENVLRGRLTGFEEATALIEIEPGVRLRIPRHGLDKAREAVVALRAEDLILALEPPVGLSAQNILAGIIREIRDPDPQRRGEGPLLAMVAPGGSGASVLVVAITRQACHQLGLAAGLGVHVIFKTQACRVLAAR